MYFPVLEEGASNAPIFEGTEVNELVAILIDLSPRCFSHDVLSTVVPSSYFCIDFIIRINMSVL